MSAPVPHRTTAPDWRFLLTLASITLIGPLAIHTFLPAMPAVKEHSTKATVRTLATLMPARRAASALPPIA